MDVNKRYIKKLAKKVLALIILSVLIFCILAGCIYFITLDDATFKEGDNTNAPYLVSQYTHNVSIGSDGKITTGMTAQELWDEMKRNGNKALYYLDTPEQLLKLMNAELVTQYPDTRRNPDEPIDWDSDKLNDVNSNHIQGIVKLKRANIDGNNYTMTYVDPATFQKYIDNYNVSGSDDDRKEALKHFTLEMGTPTSNEKDTKSGSDISSLSDGLFIGDSILGTMKDYLEKEGADVLYQVSANANFYLGKVGSPHTDNNLGLNKGQNFNWNKIVEITNPKFIYIVLGQNLCSGGVSTGLTSGIEDIKELVIKLQSQFPNVPVYINSVVPSGTKFSNNTSYNQGQVKANELLQQYCSSTDNITYVNTLEGYIQGDGNANSSYVSSDGLHPNSAGAKLIVENITRGNVSREDIDTNKEDKEESSEAKPKDETEKETKAVQQKIFAKVATWTEQTSTTTSDDPEIESSILHTYNMTTTNINYQDSISNFTMPFDYLWSILTITENVDLVLEIASLVYNSEIEITIHDNMEIQTNVSENTYTKEVEEVRQGENGEEIKEMKTVEYKVTQKVETKTNTLDIALTKADVWLEKYTQKFVQGEPSIITSTSGTNSNTIQKISYVSSPPKVEEKIDPNAEEDNFVKILSKSKYINSKYILTTNAYSWWIEILQNNDSTKNMIDLTNYLLNALIGRDKFHTDFSFDEFNSSLNNFAVVDYTIYGGSIQEKVWFALKDLGYSDEAVAGAMGNIDLESGGFSPAAVEKGGTGIGLIQWSFGRADQLRAYANSKGVDWSDVDTQIEFLITEISGQGPAVGYATKRTSGYIGDEKIKSTNEQWASASTVEDATLYFMRFFESPKSKATYNQSGTWGESRLTRAEKYYSQFKGKEAPDESGEVKLTGDNKKKMQSLLKEAQRIANDDRYTYSQDYRYSEFQYDCSSLVARLYAKYFNIAVPNTTGQYGTSYRVGSATSVNLQPGDVLWRSGHVTIYIGNGKYVAAHGCKGALASNPAAQISVYNDNPSEYTYVYRFITN